MFDGEVQRLTTESVAARPINARPFRYSQPSAPHPTKNTSDLEEKKVLWETEI